MSVIYKVIVFIGAMLTYSLAQGQQQSTDSIIQKQLLRQKVQWQLSDTQFESYKKEVKQYHEKMSQLSNVAYDTTAFNTGTNELIQKHLAELKKIFTVIQMEAYTKTMRINWAKYEKYTQENNIQTLGNPNTNH